MHTDTALNRSLRALADPWTLAWVLILLVNDHVLRVIAPSWITGKLGDVAWLAFAPIVVAVPLALVAPRRWSQRDRRVALLAWGLTGGLFAIVKAVPTATATFSAGFRGVFGWTPLLVCDPTDLLTLPALALAWRRWWKQASGPLHLPRRSWWVLGLAALATLANSGPPDEGIRCLVVTEEGILALPRHSYGITGTFVSTDGGLMWTEVPEDPESTGASCPARKGPWTLAVPESSTVYRFTPGQRIERSTDDGETWTVEFRLTGEEARMAYYASTRYNVQGGSGPNAAVIDPDSGNLVLAMGHEGVLVRTPAGEWTWAPVGEYHFESITGLDHLTVLLLGELQLAAAVALIATSWRTWRLFRRPGQAAVLVATLIVGFVAVVARPAHTTGYEAMIMNVLVIAVIVMALVFAIVAIVRLIGATGVNDGATRLRRRDQLLITAGLALGAAVVFLAPFVLWALSILPTYTLATSIAITLTAVALLGIAATGPYPAVGAPEADRVLETPTISSDGDTPESLEPEEPVDRSTPDEL